MTIDFCKPWSDEEYRLFLDAIKKRKTEYCEKRGLPVPAFDKVVDFYVEAGMMPGHEVAESGNLISFPAKNISLGDAWAIVKHSLDDESLSCGIRVSAIRKVAEMETHNSITKAELINALRWLFEHYDFEN